MPDIYIQLLSAGVIAAVVEGVFSIIVALKSNKLIRESTQNQINYDMQKTQYNQLTDAYNELTKMLPEEKRLSFVITNTDTTGTEEENAESLLHVGGTGKTEEMILLNHYRQYGYLLNDDQLERLEEIIKEHDECVEKGDLTWLFAVVMFENTYFEIIKEKLRELSTVN